MKIWNFDVNTEVLRYWGTWVFVLLLSTSGVRLPVPSPPGVLPEPRSHCSSLVTSLGFTLFSRLFISLLASEKFILQQEQLPLPEGRVCALRWSLETPVCHLLLTVNTQHLSHSNSPVQVNTRLQSDVNTAVTVRDV